MTSRLNNFRGESVALVICLGMGLLVFFAGLASLVIERHPLGKISQDIRENFTKEHMTV